MAHIAFDNTYANLPGSFYVKQKADPAPAPAFIKTNLDLAITLGIDPALLNSDAGLAIFAGQNIPKGAEPLAMAYAGHQFGGWSPQLGDGRALLLGEVIGKNGIRYDIQLKGSGRTPFSRGGDGKAAIGPVIREYIMSEAMAALGVPTTRALAAVTTGEIVIRDTHLPGAIFTRVAQSHIRVGTFQYFYAKQDYNALKTLTDYVIERHYPAARDATNPISALYAALSKRQAKLIALWLKYGFIHGVMNTDNMQIAGETIDYGPCAFMDTFHPGKVFSSIDQTGRYAWGRQPQLAHWNLTRLGEALIPIWGAAENIAETEVRTELTRFGTTFNTAFHKAFAEKLGLPEFKEENPAFLEDTFQIMTDHKIDFTLFFSYLRRLTQDQYRTRFTALFGQTKDSETWLQDWEKQRSASGISETESEARMAAANPIYIPRNHRVEEAIIAGQSGDYARLHKLCDVLQTPFTEQNGQEEYENAPLPHEVIHQTFCGT